MKRFLLSWLLLFLFWEINGQIYTGGAGDGATMSCVPPKVTTLSATKITCVTGDIVLSIQATGTSVQYNWQKRGPNGYVDLPENERYEGLGTATLTIKDPTVSADSGRYRCFVVNSCDSDTSEIFYINLNKPPKLEMPLEMLDYAQGVCVNSGYRDLISSFTSEREDIYYTWRKVDTLSGRVTMLEGNDGVYRVDLAGAAADKQGLYIVTASNECGSISDSVFLPVYEIPKIRWFSDNIVDGVMAVCIQENIPLNALISGGGSYMATLNQVEYDPITDDWKNINRVYRGNVAEYTYYVAGRENAGYYRWEIVNECNAGTPSYSEILEVIVDKVPSFIEPVGEVYQFPDTTVCEGSRLKLWCQASGRAVQYYWTKDGQRIEGSNSNELVLENVSPEDVGKYYCVAYNNCVKRATSRPIQVNVNLLPRFSRDPYMRKKACVSDSVSYFGVIPETGYDSLRWLFNRQPIYDNGHYLGADQEDFLIYDIGAADLGLYQVQVWNGCGSNISEVMNLMELAIPVSFTKGVGGYDLLLCPGMEQRLSVNVLGSKPIHYKWIFNEHTYQTDTNFVEVAGQGITEKNKYTVYAYNACGSAVDTGFVYVEVFEKFNFTGSGEYCAGHTPTGVLELSNTADSLNYNLYRDYGILVETRRGNGRPMKFENMPGGIYYIEAVNPKTECFVRMNGEPVVVEWPAPKAPNFFVSSYYCVGNAGAELVLAEWEKDVAYQLMRNQGDGFKTVPYTSFVGGSRIFQIPELNSPADGEPKIYSNMDYGRYKVVATGVNGCTSESILPDSIYAIAPPARHKLMAAHDDTMNCNIPLSDGSIYMEYSELQVDRFIEGATYTLYKNGVVHPDKEPDRTSPIGWAQIDEGEYYVVVTTREGCTATTNIVRINSVDAPKAQSLSGSGSLCAELDTEDTYKTLTIDGTEVGVIYEVYRQNPFKLWDTFVGDGNPKDIVVPSTRATYYAKAYDPSRQCVATMENEYTVLASDFQVETNPKDIFLDSKGLVTWLHVDITGTFVQPLDVKWHDEDLLQQTGPIANPNTQIWEIYHWPFCPCAGKHDYNGSTHDHGYSHGPHCTVNNCPFLYHAQDPVAQGCTYMGTEYEQYERYSSIRTGPKVSTYYCRDKTTSSGPIWYENDEKNPYRDRLTTPVNEDRIYTVTVTDAAGCTHSDQVMVGVLGGKLRAEILNAEEHKHYEYPFCPCAGNHRYHNRCTPACNDNNCPRLYHAHTHAGCTKRKTEMILYNGVFQKHYDQYLCCTEQEAADMVVYKNTELFFCSGAQGGDYTYEKTWSYYSEEDPNACWSGFAGDTVTFLAQKSGWLYLRVTSMGQEVRDSIWIDVIRKPFEAYIQDEGGIDRIDSLYICKGEEVKLYAFYEGGDSPTTTLQWYGEGYSGPNTAFWIFTPEKSGWFELTATNDGVVIKDTVYILLRDIPDEPVVEDLGVRCVLPGQTETIKIPSPTLVGCNYILEYSPDGSSWIEFDRENNSAGGRIDFLIKNPIRDAGLYRVKVESMALDHGCASYSETLELITPPSHSEISDLTYCYGDELTLQLTSTEPGMSYTVMSNRNIAFETIEHPRDYFTKQFGIGIFRMVYTHNGMTGSCSDTTDFEITRIAQAKEVGIVINEGGREACEGENSSLTLTDTEEGVVYYLTSPSGAKIDLFTGDGGDMTTLVSSYVAGAYVVHAQKEGCETRMGWFNINRNPKPLRPTDLEYCYPYGIVGLGEGVELVYSGLEDGVTYVLQSEGVSLDTIQGPGTHRFDGKYQEGTYTIIGTSDETGCSSSSSFQVIPRQSPKDFTLQSDCEQEKMIKIPASQTGVDYYLKRGTEVVGVFPGTGTELEFGRYTTTGIYTAYGVDTSSGCQEDMLGAVQITHLDICQLEQQNPICNVLDVTALTLPCSSKGWTYTLKDVTTTDTLYSDKQEGTGETLRWTSVGDKMIGMRRSGRTYIPSRYLLYAQNDCGEVFVDSVTVTVVTNPSGELATENLSFSEYVPLETCPNQYENVYVVGSKAGQKYTLIGQLDRGYSDTLTVFMAQEDNEGRHLFGSYKGYEGYKMLMDNQGCTADQTIQILFKDMPGEAEVLGEGVCDNVAPLVVSIPNKVHLPYHNFYLMYSETGKAVDTLSWDDVSNVFADQTLDGRYWVVVENIDPVSQARLCSDTLKPGYAVGASPTAFPVVRYPQMTQDEILLCEGDSAVISVSRTEPTVEYGLFKDGVEISEARQYRVDGGELTFPITQAGEYTIIGFLGHCEEPMQNSIKVRVGKSPELDLPSVFSYCEGEPGAKVEIHGAPQGITFDLRIHGLASPIIESDTVKAYYGNGVSDTISFDHICPLGSEYEYVLTYATLDGCSDNHSFTIEEVKLPVPFDVYTTGDAICEGGCTEFAVLGDQQNVGYALWKVDDEIGDYEYNDNFILGWGDRDTMWFPYPVCERGVYYVKATYFEGLQCSSPMMINGSAGHIEMAEVDTIQDCTFAESELHYCVNTAEGVSIVMNNAQLGIKYYLHREGTDYTKVPLNWIKTCYVGGETLVWEDVYADGSCDGEYDNSTRYWVMAVNPATRCTKYMETLIQVIANKPTEISAESQPYYEICEVNGEVLLKARAEGCGLEYTWNMVGNPDVFVGEGRDIIVNQPGEYYCEVSNACSPPPARSSRTLVDVRPEVTMEPVGEVLLCEGVSGVVFSDFSEVQDGDYAWYKLPDTTIVLSSKPWLEFDKVQRSDEGEYICVGGSIQRGYCNVMKDTILVRVDFDVNNIDLPLQYDTICTGTTKVMETNLYGHTVSWYFNGQEVPGVSGVAYRKEFFTRDAGIYSVKVASSCGDREPIPVFQIDVDTLIEHSWHTEDKFLCQPSIPLPLSIRTFPMGTTRFLWQQTVNGVTQPIGYTPDITVMVPEDAGQVIYGVFYYNTCNSQANMLVNGSQYQEVVVNIARNIQPTIAWPEEISFCEGTSADDEDRTLKVGMSGVSISEYIWVFTAAGTQKIDTVSRGATADEYIIPDNREASGLYNCILVTDCGKLRYDYSCWVRINTPATFISDLETDAGVMCEGTFYTPSVTATGSDLQFRWVLKSKSGTVDTLQKGMGYEWEDSHALYLEADEKYADDTLKCFVYNNCAIDSTDGVVLQIKGRNRIEVEPETFVCYDSLAEIHVKMYDSQGDPYLTGEWSYEAQRGDYNPVKRSVAEGQYIDTLFNMQPGEYVIKNLVDGVCNYADQELAVFIINSRQKIEASTGLERNRLDTTICVGALVPFYFRTNGGVGPFEATIWYRTPEMADWEPYSEFPGVNPYLVDASKAKEGYTYPLSVSKEGEYMITLKDLNGGREATDACDVLITNRIDETIRVKVITRKAVGWGMIGKTDFGECELPLNLMSILNPTVAGGKFNITKLQPGAADDSTIRRDVPYLLAEDGPGQYKITYSMGGYCDDGTNYPITISVDSLPKAVFVPQDTVVCQGGLMPSLFVQLSGAEPFDSLQVVSSRLKRDMTTEDFQYPGWTDGPFKGTTINTPRHKIAFSYTNADSVINFILVKLKDRHGCAMKRGDYPSTTVTVMSPPQLLVEGSHKAYGGGYWNDMTERYTLPEGDSVKFRATLTKGRAPWTLFLSHDAQFPITTPPTVITVHGRDTILTMKEEGCYLFQCIDAYGCELPISQEAKRELLYKPDGYVDISGVFLGGAMADKIGKTITTVADRQNMMKSALYNNFLLPDYGLDKLVTYLNRAIDWVFVEARRQEVNGTWVVVDRDTCLLLADGRVMSRDGTINIRLEGTGVTGELHHIAIFHRNHLPIMSKAVQLNDIPGTSSVLLSTGDNLWLENPSSDNLADHYWNIASLMYAGNTLWAMVPSYLHVNTTDQLVSMSNPNVSIRNEQTGIMDYYEYDVNLNGYIEMAGFITDITQLNNYGSQQDAWLLLLNRNRYSQIKPLP